MSTYGEPWWETVEQVWTQAHELAATMECRVLRLRAMDCVNALAGRDPAALAELEAAAQAVSDWPESAGSFEACDIRLKAALAAFRQEGEA
jgi:hypothetical protein